MGKVVTFYSYKGGVGRTFLLANVAVMFAKWGRRVLCIDWDLEAPGLLHYFGTDTGQRVVGGVIDIVSSVATDRRVEWRDMVVSIEGDEDWSLDLLSAGRPGDEYVRTLHGLDWHEFYDEHELGWTLEELRAQWSAEYDLVLIDSRTGLTDIGGVCVAQLPDILVVLSSANEQSLAGCLDVIDRAMRARDRLPVPRPGPLVLPLASRFDEREEYDDAARWLDRFSDAWTESYRVWAVDGVEPRKLLNLLRIPYVSKWSFGEHLPARHERTDDPGLVSWSVANVAACLASGLGRMDELVSSRDGYIDGIARQLGEDDAKSHDVFISYVHEDAALAQELRDALVERGLSVFTAFENIGLGMSITESVSRALAHSRIFAIFVTERSRGSESVSYELGRARDERLTIVPIYIGRQALESAPSMLRDINGVVTEGAMGPVADAFARLSDGV